MHWPSPEQRHRIAEIRDNLTARITEAEREGWLGEIEGLKITLAGADAQLAQIDRRSQAPAAVTLGMPGFPAAAVSSEERPGNRPRARSPGGTSGACQLPPKAQATRPSRPPSPSASGACSAGTTRATSTASGTCPAGWRGRARA